MKSHEPVRVLHAFCRSRENHRDPAAPCRGTFCAHHTWWPAPGSEGNPAFLPVSERAGRRTDVHGSGASGVSRAATRSASCQRTLPFGAFTCCAGSCAACACTHAPATPGDHAPCRCCASGSACCTDPFLQRASPHSSCATRLQRPPGCAHTGGWFPHGVVVPELQLPLPATLPGNIIRATVSAFLRRSLDNTVIECYA